MGGDGRSRRKGGASRAALEAYEEDLIEEIRLLVWCTRKINWVGFAIIRCRSIYAICLVLMFYTFIKKKSAKYELKKSRMPQRKLFSKIFGGDNRKWHKSRLDSFNATNNGSQYLITVDT